MSCPAMRVPFTLTFTGSDTQTTNWVLVKDYNLLEVAFASTGNVAGDLDLQGTNVPPAGDDPTQQPQPTATQVRTLATVSTIAVSSTVGEGEEYTDVLSWYVRLSMTDTSTNAGTVSGYLIAKRG